MKNKTNTKAAPTEIESDGNEALDPRRIRVLIQTAREERKKKQLRRRGGLYNPLLKPINKEARDPRGF